MQRILPLIAAQARPRLIGEPVSAFADEVKAALQAQPHSKLVVLGAGRAQDRAVAGAERGAGDREQRVCGGGVPGAAGLGGPERAGDPMGVVEADLGLEPGVLAVEVSLETVDRVRESFPMFRQRRL